MTGDVILFVVVLVVQLLSRVHLWPRGLRVCWGVCFLYAHFAESFFLIINIEFCQRAFSSVEMVIGFHASVCWCGVSHWLVCTEISCIPGINPIWSWYVILLIYCWIWFAKILLRIFASVLSVILAPNFLFCDIFVWFWNQGDANFVERVQKVSFLFNFFGKVWEE